MWDSPFSVSLWFCAAFGTGTRGCVQLKLLNWVGYYCSDNYYYYNSCFCMSVLVSFHCTCTCQLHPVDVAMLTPCFYVSPDMTGHTHSTHELSGIIGGSGGPVGRFTKH